MQTVPQAPATREHLNELIAELYGDSPAALSTADARWQHAVAQVGAHLHAKLRVEALPERMQKALELVRATAVTLHVNGSASVQSGTQTYTLAPDCPCADAKHRTELCKHALAVELHRRALAVFHGEAPALAPSPAAAGVALPPAAPSTPASHAWDVHEAPASACVKFRVGTMELMYTLRGVDDAELQRRMTATLPTLQELMAACEARAAQRLAERDAAQALPVPPPASAPADLQALLQQAVQHALSAQAANGQAQSTPPPVPPSNGLAAAPEGPPLCPLHHVVMELRQNQRGSWWSHRLADGSYCKGK